MARQKQKASPIGLNQKIGYKDIDLLTSFVTDQGKILPRPSSTKITFGDPLMPDEGQNAKRFAEKLETAVAALADEASTDWWQARRRAYSKTSPDLTGPEVGGWRRIWALGKNDRRSQRKRWPDF